MEKQYGTTAILCDHEEISEKFMIYRKKTVAFFLCKPYTEIIKNKGGLFHEILNEYCRDEVIADVIAWMNHRI